MNSAHIKEEVFARECAVLPETVTRRPWIETEETDPKRDSSHNTAEGALESGPCEEHLSELRSLPSAEEGSDLDDADIAGDISELQVIQIKPELSKDTDMNEESPAPCSATGSVACE